MKSMLSTLRIAAVAALAFFAPAVAFAQVVSQVPTFTGNAPGIVKDLGNGPTEIRVVQGNAQVFTMQGSGVSTTVTASTAMTLTASAAANPPCVGCIISGAGITSGTTVAAFNGTTGITLSAAMTVANNTPVAWGMACPSTVGSNPVMLVQASVGLDLPLYTQSRVCVAGQNTVGATLLQYPIGAH